MECKLVETLSKCRMTISNPPDDYQCSEKCSCFGNCRYKSKILNEKLESYKMGWMKYILYNFSKVQSTDNKNVKVSSILHLIHHSEPDLIIFRVAKYSPKTKEVKVRYIVEQKQRSQLCSDLKDLFVHMHKNYQYEGRPLTANDFKLEE